MKYLVLLTTSYPFGKREPFIESEIRYIRGFDKIIIFSSRAEDEVREIKSVSAIDYYRINAFKDNYSKRIPKLFFSKLFYKELYNLIVTKRLCVYNIKWLVRTTLIALNTYSRAKKIIREKYDSFLTDNVTYYSYWLSDHAMAAILLKKKFGGKKVVSRAHRTDLYEEEDIAGYIPYRQFLLKHLDYVVPISEDGANYLNKYDTGVKIHLSRLGVVDNGVNPPQCEDSTIIVSCSWCRSVKRIDKLIFALSLIRNKKITWVHIGNGELFNKLQEQAASMLPENVSAIFLGEMSNEDILNYYRTHHIDIFVNVSSSEGVPVSIMEALSFGIPVIATDVGGTSEAVVSGVNGLLIPRDFPTELLVNSIVKLIDMPTRDMGLLRKGCRTFWEQNYLAEKNYREFNEFLNF